LWNIFINDNSINAIGLSSVDKRSSAFSLTLPEKDDTYWYATSDRTEIPIITDFSLYTTVFQDTEPQYYNTSTIDIDGVYFNIQLDSDNSAITYICGQPFACESSDTYSEYKDGKVGDIILYGS